MPVRIHPVRHEADIVIFRAAEFAVLCPAVSDPPHGDITLCFCEPVLVERPLRHAGDRFEIGQHVLGRVQKVAPQQDPPPVAADDRILRESRVNVAEGSERPCQLWQVEKHSDGSISAARVSFCTELPAEGS
jgi:hypothetical protein